MVMKDFIQLVCFVLLVTLAGCCAPKRLDSLSSSQRVLLVPYSITFVTWTNWTWRDTEHPEQVEFFVNGDSQGRGRLGFKKVLAALTSLEPHSRVIFYRNLFPNSGGQPYYVEPYARLDLDADLREVIDKNELDFQTCPWQW